jgi:hypothetical protein
MHATQLNTDQLFAQWLLAHGATLPPEMAVIRVRRAEPRFQTRNYFARFKIETARLDGDGTNPTEISCVVVEVSETDQTAQVAAETGCDSIKDL